jgi:telomerase reverse transcriptase
MKRKRASKAQRATKKPKLDDDPQPSHPLLRKYYADVVTLRQYLVSRLKKKRRRRLQQYGQDPSTSEAAVSQLLDVTVVGTFGPVHVQDESIIVEEDISMFTQQLSDSGVTSSLTSGSLKQSEVGI